MIYFVQSGISTDLAFFTAAYREKSSASHSIQLSQGREERNERDYGISREGSDERDLKLIAAENGLQTIS